MRVFIAAELPEVWREELWQAGRALTRLGVRGRFTRRENFHLTLAFLGEVSQPGGVMAAMDRSNAPVFPLETTQADRFVLRGGEIWWVGVVPHPRLLAAQTRLCDTLRSDGFVLDRRPFLPHITLARRVFSPGGIGPEALTGLLTPMETKIRALTLMRSERSRGGAVYTPIHRTPLGSCSG